MQTAPPHARSRPAMLEIRKLHPLYGAEIVGVDTGRPMNDATFAAVRAAFEEYAVLLFRGQSLDDERQIAFSERFGPLENTVSANSGGGGAFARQSNIDIETGEPIPSRSEEHTSELQSLMRISYAVFC